MTAVQPYQAQSLADRMQYAQTIASAGDLIPKALHDKNMKTLENGTQVPDGTTYPNYGKVLLVMETGAMLGMHPIAALSGIYVIEGKPSASAGTMQAVVRQAGHKLRVTTEGSWDAGTFEAKAELIRSDDPDFTFRAIWTKERAQRAGLLGKGTWKAYPEMMAKARAVSEVVREGAEDAMHGVHYTPEELGANVTESGDIIDGEVVEDAPTPEAKPARRKPTNGRQGTKRKAPEPEDQTDVAPEDQHDNGTPDEPTPVVAGEPIESGPMQGLVPTEAQVQAAQVIRDLQEQGTDTTVAEAILDEPIPDEGQAAVLADDTTGEVIEDAELEDEDGAFADEHPNPDASLSEADWEALLRAAESVEALQAVWNRMVNAGARTSKLTAVTTARKNVLSA